MLGSDSEDPDDPITSGCWDANAYIANSAPFGPAGQAPWGYVANWYSPDCGTNWAETVWTNNPQSILARLHAFIVDDVTGENYYFEEANGEIYTDMTHSEFDRACADGGLETESGMHYESSLACA